MSEIDQLVDENGFRVPAQGEVRTILDAHDQWLRSRGKSGQAASFAGLDLSGMVLRAATLRKADLRGVRANGTDFTGANLYRANLQGADLSGARLVRADLERADFNAANLSGANFQGADLNRANLSGSQLRQAILRDANLTDANLLDARGVIPGQLCGTNLTRADLPPELAKFEGLANVTEASKATQNLFTSILFVCAYTWLTIASASDAQLVNNAAPPSSRLPIVGIDIPLVRFFIASPFLLVCLYVYFHLMLQRLWEELAELPAIFPDGRAVDKKAYPWLLNVLVRAHVPRLRENRSHLSRWQARISSMLAWGLVPATVLFAWARYLHAHDWYATGLHILCLSIAAGVGMAFLKLAAATLRGSERRAFMWQRAWKDARAVCVVTAVLAAVGFFGLSLGVIEGVDPESVYEPAQAKRLAAGYNPLDVRRWVPALLRTFYLGSAANLTDAPLSTKPANWSPANPELLDTVKGADLEHRQFSRNLRHAMAYNAFCVNAYLQSSDLRWADFRQSDLRRADFRKSLLTGINLRFADLRGADFRNADLSLARVKQAKAENARFEDANLANAVLSESNFSGANLTRANLSGADLSKSDLGPVPNLVPAERKPTTLEGANLTRANLTAANLTAASLQPATTTSTASTVPDATKPQPVLLVQARLIGANLSGANLTGADLTGADLRNAILRAIPDFIAPNRERPTTLVNARLQAANLVGADLSGADLSGADLRQADLTGATLDGAILNGVDLTSTIGLTSDQLANTIRDDATKLPESVRKVARQETDSAHN